MKPLFWYSFPGKNLGVHRSTPFSIPPPIAHTSKKGAHCVAGKKVVAVLYNSGQHLYEDWSNSWPNQPDPNEQPWQHLSFREYWNGKTLHRGRAVLFHQGHMHPAANSRANVRLQTENGFEWHMIFYPKVMYYLIDCGGGAEAFFESRKIVIPASLLPLG